MGVGVGVATIALQPDLSRIVCDANAHLNPRAIFGPDLLAWFRSDLGVVLQGEILVDGNCEAIGTAAWGDPGWTPVTKQPGGHSGAQCLQLDYNVPHGFNYCFNTAATYIQGQTRISTGWMKVHTPGGAVATLSDAGGIVLFTANAALQDVWQPYVVTWTAAFATGSQCYWMISGGAGGDYVQLDDMTEVVQHLTAWNDQSDNAHNFAQLPANVAQPLFVPSGTPNGRPSIRGDGVAQFMATAAFAQAQPDSFAISSIVTPNAFAFVLDGGTSSSHSLYQAPATVLGLFAGFGLALPAWVGNAWRVHRGLYDGANSFIAANDAAPVVGNAGATARDGLTLFATGIPNGFFQSADVSEIVLVRRAMTPLEETLLNRYMMAWSGI